MNLDTFADVVSSHALAAPNRTCLFMRSPHGDMDISWAEFERATRSIASQALPCDSIRRPRIGVIADDPYDFLAAVFGVIRSGASVVPLPDLLISSIDAILQDCGLDVLITDEPNSRLLCDNASVRTLSIERLRAGHGEIGTADFRQAAAVRPSDEMTVFYSSGSTADPKGIVHSHAARCHVARSRARDFEIDRTSRTLITAPLYTARAISSICCTLFAGGACIIVPKFDVRTLQRIVEELMPTSLSLVPTQYSLLLRDRSFKPDVFRRCRFLMCGGSPLGGRLAVQLFTLFPETFVQGYGSTETELISLLPRHAPSSKRGSVGLPVSDAVVRIVAPHGEDLPRNQVGEVAVSTPSMFEKYTSASDMAGAFEHDADGMRFYRTGDLGLLDDDGYLWLAGRKKDLIITAGFNILPSDVEAVLLQHPDVDEAAVVGIPMATLGETPVAVVVLRPRARANDVTASQICRWANARLNRNQKLYRVLAVDELPKNYGGKTHKGRLRHIAADRAGL